MNKKGWISDFKGSQYKGIKISADLINADTGEVAAEAGTKMTPRYINKLMESGSKNSICKRSSSRSIRCRRYCKPENGTHLCGSR